VPYFDVIVPAGAAIGQTVDAKISQTVDAKIGQTVARVTLLSDITLRIEADHDVCKILSAITEDVQTTMHVLKAGEATPAASAALPVS
jgi:hypothetical protein